MKKYRQQGYDDTLERHEKQKKPSVRTTREGPRSPQMTGFHQVFRCALCGATLPPSFAEVNFSSQCPKCDTDLYTCKNCVYFDPGARFECSEAIPKRISHKDRRNDCQFFEIRTSVEKLTTSAQEPLKAPREDMDPRVAFERLFKK